MCFDHSCISRLACNVKLEEIDSLHLDPEVESQVEIIYISFILYFLENHYLCSFSQHTGGRAGHRFSIFHPFKVYLA